MTIRNYKLEVKGTKESVTFGPRKFGEAGRDILIIKNALGAIEDYSLLVEGDTPEPQIPYEPNGWFDCLEGKKVSDAQAATFDATMRDYIVRYQLDNQFYILCYYFTKYGIPGALAVQNTMITNQYGDHPLDDVIPQKDIADWVTSDKNKIYLSGGKSIEVKASDISDYQSYTFLSRQVEMMVKMFDSEFGTLGEATLAILHGWLPRTALFNTGYYFDPRVFEYDKEKGEFSVQYAYDIVLAALFESFIDGNLSQKLDREKTKNIIKRTSRNPKNDITKEFFERYKNQTAKAERVVLRDLENPNLELSPQAGAYDFLTDQFGAIVYNTAARKPDSESILFDSLERISESFPKPILSAKTQERNKELLERVIEPDPFINPDPFIINENKVGYFLKTEFTLENLPPFPGSDNYDSIIQELEDIALSHVMSFYGKPEIFYLDTRDVEYQIAFIGDMRQYFLEPKPAARPLPSAEAGPRPSHNGEKLSKIYDENLKDQIWVLATQTNHTDLKLGKDVETYRSYERDSQGNLYQDGIIEPLIKFVEFRTPSLRPGDAYRAKFFINKEKLDYIKEGYKERLTAEQEKVLQSFPVSRSARIKDLCDTNASLGSSIEDNSRRYEEYRSIASKNKKEITRILREKTLESYNAENILPASNIDLGVFGTIDVSNPLSSFGQSFGSLIANQSYGMSALEDPDAIVSEDLSITYANLKDRCSTAATDITRAYDLALQDKAQFKISGAKDFNGAEKAMLLSNLPIEVRQCIRKYGDSKFDFGDAPKGLGQGNYFDVSPLSNFTTIGQDEIQFHFEYNAMTGATGLQIKYISAGSEKVLGEKLKEFPSLTDPVTVSYLAQIEEMTGGRTGIESLFSPPPISCRDLGIGQRGVGYLTRYTPTLKAKTESMDEPIKRWYQSEVVDPFNTWWDDSFNFSNMFDPQFNTDAFLSVLGKQCSITKIMEDFAKISLPGFLCNFLKCLKLPAINLKLPNLNIPPIPPKFNIFGWYVGLINQMLKKFFEILVRILCSLLQFILDFLSSPFCEEQLRDELYGEFAGQAPLIQQALVDGLFDLGISKDSMLPAKDFIGAALSFLTGAEICALLKGETIDPASMAMLEDLSTKFGLEELSNPASIRSFFETLGIMVPDFCDDLEAANWVISTTDCEETTSASEQYRRKMLAGEATQEDMDKALELLEKNLNDQLERLRALGDQGIQALLPDVVNFGDPDAILNKLPGALEDQANQTMRQLFEPAKMGYLSSLSSFGPGLFLDAPTMPKPGDPEFDAEAHAIVSTILQNFRSFAYIMDPANRNSDFTEQDYISQLNVLHMVYEQKPNEGLKAYRWTPKNPTRGSFNPNTHYSHFYKEEFKNNFTLLTPNDAAQIDAKDIIYKPIGFSEDSYLDAINKVDEADSYSLRESPARVLEKEKGSNLEGFSFQMNYIIEKLAEKPVMGLRKNTEGDVELRPGATGAGQQVVITAIKNRVNKMQGDLFAALNTIATPRVGSQYLGTIARLFSQANETLNENLKSANGDVNELIDINNQTLDIGGSRQNINSLILNLSEGALQASVKYNEFPNTKSVKFDPYSIEIYSDNMFNRDSSNPLTIEVCDTIPGPDKEQQSAEREEVYERAIRELELTASSGEPIYTRREIFARKIMSSLHAMARRYKRDNQHDHDVTDSISKINKQLDPTNNQSRGFKSRAAGKMYSSAMEGIFEQIFFALSSSRIYNETDYYPGLNNRIAGLMTLEGDGTNQCVRNRYSVSQLGLLSFEKMVTDELSKQLASELSKPENAPQNLDYDDEGPFEKAIKNVCFLGFVRICLVELLLKGALAYSVWDFEGVFDEKIFEEFIFEYVKSELNNKEAMKVNWEKMASRITGIENSETALKKLVRNQSMKMLDVSKKIYQNSDADVTDYHNWYSKYFIPQTHCSRKIAIRSGSMSLGLQELDTATGTVGASGDFRRGGAQVIYWAHPLLDISNIRTDNVIRREEGTALTENFRDLVGSNDPFFHIEHLVEVQGPLASIEGITIPGSAITNSILNADISKITADPDTEESKAIRKVSTFVGSAQVRSPQRLNINDARMRTNLPRLDLGSYGFQANPTQPEGAAGAALEKARELNSRGEVDPNTYAESTEVYNIKDFKESLNFKVTDGNMKKFLRHVQGYMYHPQEGEELDLTGPIQDTSHELLDEYPEEVKRLPTKFIKKTRRIVKFKEDFVTGLFDDLMQTNGVEKYKNALYGVNGPEGFLGNNRSNQSIETFNRWKDKAELQQESTEYYINPGNAEVLYEVFDKIKQFKDDNGFRELEGNFLDDNLFTDNDASEINEIVDKMPEEISEEYLNSELAFVPSGDIIRTEVFTGKDNGHANIDKKSHGDKFKGFVSPGLVRVDSKPVGQSAGISWNKSVTNSPGAIEGGKLTVERSENGNKEIVFENKIGQFDTKQDYDDAIRKITSLSDTAPVLDTALAEVAIREEHWVETVYEFSGDSAILAGVYGSYTIGETMDPAVFTFDPDENTKGAWARVIAAIRQRHGNTSIKLFKNSPAVCYGRTFWPLAGEKQEFAQTREEYMERFGAVNPSLEEEQTEQFNTTVGNRDENIPFIARPMGIDKLTNRRLTSKLLTRAVDSPDTPVLGAYAPYGRTIVLEPGSAGSAGQETKYRSLTRPSYTSNGSNRIIHDRTRPIIGLSPRTDNLDSYSDIKSMIHSRPLLAGTLPVYSAQYLLPPNIYRIPLRVLVTQVYIDGNVEKVYARVVPPKYIQNLSDRKITNGQYPESVAQNKQYLNQSIQKICNEYVDFLEDLTAVSPNRQGNEPQFTRDFHFDFKKKETIEGSEQTSEGRRFSAIDKSTVAQYCSIERIYSEAFHIEASQANVWNSKEELDRLFEDRGKLMMRQQINVSRNTLSKFDEDSDRITYLESLNYFYSISEDTSLVSENIRANDFHRVVFSLNNVMQWFLRFRRHDSLWGLLTPQDSGDSTTDEYGWGGKQKFPLGRLCKTVVTDGFLHIADNKSSPYRSPWQMGFFTYANNQGRGLRTSAWQFYKEYQFGTKEYSQYRYSTGYPEGALCLDHNWTNSNDYVPSEDDSSNWYGIMLDYKNKIIGSSIDKGGVLDRATADPGKYLVGINRKLGTGAPDLTKSFPLLDSFGDYYTNYNRLNAFPMLQTGGSLFAADGRITMDDISTAMKISISNIFEKLDPAAGSVIVASIDRSQDEADFFKDEEGNISVQNYKFIKDYLLVIGDDGPSPADAPLSIGGIHPNNSPNSAIVKVLIQDFNDRRLSTAIKNCIQEIKKLLDYSIKQCGAQLRFQTFMENTGKNSIFASNQESLKQLSILKKFLNKIDSYEGDSPDLNTQKIVLLLTMSGYDFAKVILKEFSPKSSFASIKSKAEADWALCCLMWIHMWYVGNHKEKPLTTDNQTFQPRGTFANIVSQPNVYLGRYTFYSPPGGDGSTYVLKFGLHRDDRGNWNIGEMGIRNQEDGEIANRMIQMITTVKQKIIPVGTFNSEQVIWTNLVKVSDQGIRSHDGQARHTRRLFLDNGSKGAGINKLRKFLEPNGESGIGDWNYDYSLGRPLTNREIIDYTYRIMDFSKLVSREMMTKSDWELYLFGGQGTPVPPFERGAYAEIIKSGLEYFEAGVDVNLKKHPDRKWRNTFYKTLGESGTVDVHKHLVNKIRYLKDRGFISRGFSMEKEGLTDQAEGIVSAISNLNAEIARKNQFKTTLYRWPSARGLDHDYALKKRNLSLILGKEAYNAMQIKDASFSADSKKAAQMSPKAARGYTLKKVQAFYNDQSIDNYRTFAFFMKFRYQQALKNNTGIPQAIGPTMFDSAAIINNQVINGLFENSKIDQVARLVINFNDLGIMGDHVTEMITSKAFQLMAEEQRSILMAKSQDMTGFDSGNMTLSVPIAEYREAMSKFGMTGDEESDNFLVSCYTIDTLVEDFEKKTSWMAQELLSQDSCKLFLKYIFPTKRYQALATIFATTSMSGYTTMPALMRAPKSSLSFLMGISSMSSKERMEMFKNMSQAELFKSLSDNKSSEPRAMKCFDLPFNEDFLDQFLDLLWEQIKEFPAVLFRGLANVIDPAYKEMKMHWDDCDMEKLTYSGWKPFTAKDRNSIQGGAHGKARDPGEPGNKKYASLLVTSAADIGWSISRLFVPGQMSDGAKGLAHAVSHITNYVYKGPLSLLDGGFQFQFPCKDVAETWDPGSTFNSGRYGHPFTPLTYIALAMPELRGDKRLRQMSGRCEDDFDAEGSLRARLDSKDNDCAGEEPPFGGMPEPNEFEE